MINYLIPLCTQFQLLIDSICSISPLGIGFHFFSFKIQCQVMRVTGPLRVMYKSYETLLKFLHLLILIFSDTTIGLHTLFFDKFCKYSNCCFFFFLFLSINVGLNGISFWFFTCRWFLSVYVKSINKYTSFLDIEYRDCHLFWI